MPSSSAMLARARLQEGHNQGLWKLTWGDKRNRDEVRVKGQISGLEFRLVGESVYMGNKDIDFCVHPKYWNHIEERLLILATHIKFNEVNFLNIAVKRDMSFIGSFKALYWTGGIAIYLVTIWAFMSTFVWLPCWAWSKLKLAYRPYRESLKARQSS